MSAPDRILRLITNPFAQYRTLITLTIPAHHSALGFRWTSEETVKFQENEMGGRKVVLSDPQLAKFIPEIDLFKKGSPTKDIIGSIQARIEDHQDHSLAA